MSNIVQINAQKVRERMEDIAPDEEIPAIGGAGGDGMDIINYWLSHLEKRFERLDVRLDKIDARFDKNDARFDKSDERRERDFRLIFGALIAVALGLASLMAKGFHWL